MSAHRTTRALGVAATGLLLAGAGVAAGSPSASAATTLVYSCTSPVGPADVSTTIDTNAPATLPMGESFSGGTGTVVATLPSSLSTGLMFLGYDSISGVAGTSVQVVDPTGATRATMDSSLDAPKVKLNGSGTTLNATGAAGTTPVADVAGDWTLLAPTTVTMDITPYDAAGEPQPVIQSSCTYKSGNRVIDTISVS